MSKASEDRRHWPVFLVGCHRSGTTLVRYILDAHPNLACPPESKFIKGLYAFCEYPQAWEAICSLNVSPGDIYNQLRAIIDSFLGGYARRQGKKRWVDKTPNYYDILPFIDRLFSGQVLYLLTVRHPLDSVISMEEAYGTPIGGRGDPDLSRHIAQNGRSIFSWARYWNLVNENLLAFASANPARCLLLRYEDLVTDAPSTVKALLGFLEEPYTEDLLTSAFTCAHTEGYADYKIRATTGIHRNSVGIWREWPRERTQSLWPMVAELAGRLGYEEQ